MLSVWKVLSDYCTSVSPIVTLSQWEQIFWWKICQVGNAIENYYRAGRAGELTFPQEMYRKCFKYLHFKTEIIWKQWERFWTLYNLILRLLIKEKPCFKSLKLSISLYIIHMKQKSKETNFAGSGKSVRSGVPHLSSDIITWLYPFSLEKIELFVLFHVRLHWKEVSFVQQL